MFFSLILMTFSQTTTGMNNTMDMTNFSDDVIIRFLRNWWDVWNIPFTASDRTIAKEEIEKLKKAFQMTFGIRMVDAAWIANEYYKGRRHVVLNPNGNRASWAASVPNTEAVKLANGRAAYPMKTDILWPLVEEYVEKTDDTPPLAEIASFPSDEMLDDLASTITIMQQLIDTPNSAVARGAAESCIESLVAAYNLEHAVKRY